MRNSDCGMRNKDRTRKVPASEVGSTNQVGHLHLEGFHRAFDFARQTIPTGLIPLRRSPATQTTFCFSLGSLRGEDFFGFLIQSPLGHRNPLQLSSRTSFGSGRIDFVFLDIRSAPESPTPAQSIAPEEPVHGYGCLLARPQRNVMLLILNLPLVGLWAKMVAVPYYIMGPMILLFSFIGAFSVRNNFFDVWTALFFGILGYLMDKVKVPTTPMVLSLILIPMLESALRQSLSMAAGSPVLLFTRPLTLIFLIASVLMTIFSLYARYRKPKIKEYLLGDKEEAK